MVRLREWDEEAAAGELLADVLGGRWTRNDLSRGGTQEYDLRLTLPSGSDVAVEVTQEMDARIREQYSLETKSEMIFVQLHGLWTVSVREPVNLLRLRRQLSVLLEGLEAEGISQVVVTRNAQGIETPEAFAALGIGYAIRLADQTPGQIALSPRPSAGSVGAHSLNAVVTSHVGRSDNLLKLGSAGGVSERHLFIWVDSTVEKPSVALRLRLLPDEPVALPADVDVVWTAPAFEKPSLLRFDRESGWRYLR